MHIHSDKETIEEKQIFTREYCKVAFFPEPSFFSITKDPYILFFERL